MAPLSNYPPGVSTADIPGWRDQDVLFDTVVEGTCGKCWSRKVCRFCDSDPGSCHRIKEALSRAEEGPDPDRAYEVERDRRLMEES